VVSGGLDILVAAGSSAPAAELAAAIRTEARGLGASADIVRELPRGTENATLLVAPDEALRRVEETEAERLDEFLSRSILLVLAHPSTAEWEATLPYAERAAALFHVSDAGIAAFKRMGRRVRRFPLGYHESFDRWQEREEERDVDVAFLGVASPRRERLLAELAGRLAARSTRIYFPDRPSDQERRLLDFVSGESKLELLARSRTILDLHSDNDPAFGWLRAVQAVCNGCLVVSETATDCSPLRPGEHLLTATADDLGPVLDEILEQHERLEKLRHDAYRFLRDELPLRSSVEPLLDVVDQLPRASRRSRASRPPATAPAPPPAAAQRSDDQVTALVDAVTKQSAVLKKLFVDLRLLRRQVAQLSHAIYDPERPVLETSRTPAADGPDSPVPDVSVLVTVYNYGRFVRGALESALASRGVSVELVVIDDASTDGSPQVVREFMNDHPEDAITFIEQRINTGVQRARNLAFSMVRAPFVFVLDADNMIFPDGIAKLRRALERDPGAGYAYGLMERFTEDRSLGVMNDSAWDAARLAEEHYIDAMALIRVAGWQQVGGYVTEQSLELGWEDYDLWLSFAMAGMHGAYVREFVGRYRLHGVSSLTVTTLDTEALRARLQERHAGFFAGQQTREP
jgi:hypothetical protein